MAKNAQTKLWALQLHPDGTKQSQPYVGGPTQGGAPTLALSRLSSTSIRVGIAAQPDAGRSVIAYEVQRSLNGVDGWVTVPTPEPVAVSEIPAQITSTPNKWVHPSGTYLGNPAFTSLQAALDTLNPGDHLAIAPGTYAERAILTRSGTVSQPIIIRCADYSNRPTFDGQYSSGIIPGWVAPFAAGQCALLNIMASNVVVDGLNFIRSTQSGLCIGDCANNMSFTGSPSVFYTNIRMIRCDVRGTNSASWRTINVDDCRFYGCVSLDSERNQLVNLGTGILSGWGSAVFFMGKRIWHVECVVGQCTGEGFHVGYHGRFGGGDGYAHIQADRFVIRNCRVFDTWSGPIYVTNTDGTEADPSIIEGNVVWHTGDTRYMYGGNYAQYGIDFGSESAAQTDPSNNPETVRGTNNFIGSRHTIVRNNVVTGSLYCFRFANWPSQQTTGIKVLNNTFYKTVSGSASSEASLVANFESELSNIEFVNNQVLDAFADRVCREWLTPAGTWIRGANLFSAAPPASLTDASNVISPAQAIVEPEYQPSGTYPAVSTFDVSKIRLIPASPAVNAGQVRADVLTDIFGNVRPTESGKIDIGAHSLSKPLSVAFVDISAPSGASTYYRARFTQSDLAVKTWSAATAAP